MRLIVLLSFFCSVSCFAQINIYEDQLSSKIEVDGNKERAIDLLKRSELIVVIPAKLDEIKFRSYFQNIWDLSSYKFVGNEEFKTNKSKLLKVGTPYLNMNSTVTIKSKSNDGTQWRNVGEYIRHKYDLRICYNIKKKKGKNVHQSLLLGELIFSPNIALRTSVIAGGGRKSVFLKTSNKKAVNSNDESPGFNTYNDGYMKDFLKVLNNSIVSKSFINLDDGFINTKNIGQLKKEKLYAPEWILKRYNALGGTLKSIDTKDVFFEDYDFEVEIIKDDALNKKILDGENIYYILHTQYNANKIISILNPSIENVVYLESKSGSYNMKAKDFKNLNKAINK